VAPDSTDGGRLATGGAAATAPRPEPRQRAPPVPLAADRARPPDRADCRRWVGRRRGCYVNFIAVCQRPAADTRAL
jgi:hypothetical protein